MPEHRLLTGPEPLRRAHVKAAVPTDAATIDCDTDADQLLALLSSDGGLFAVTHVRARNLGALTLEQARQLNTLLSDTTVTVIAEADSIPAAHERALKNLTVTRLGVKGRSATEYQQIASLLGTSIKAPDAARLDALAGDHGAAVSVIEIASAAGIARIDRDLLERLVVNHDAPGMPWTLVDALEQGNTTKASREIDRCEPIPTIAYAAKRWIMAALAAEGRTASEAAHLLGGNVTDAAYGAARRIAANTSAQQRERVISQLATADRHAKTGNPHAALTLACAAIAKP